MNSYYSSFLFDYYYLRPHANTIVKVFLQLGEAPNQTSIRSNRPTKTLLSANTFRVRVRVMIEELFHVYYTVDIYKCGGWGDN